MKIVPLILQTILMCKTYHEMYKLIFRLISNGCFVYKKNNPNTAANNLQTDDTLANGCCKEVGMTLQLLVAAVFSEAASL